MSGSKPPQPQVEVETPPTKSEAVQSKPPQSSTPAIKVESKPLVEAKAVSASSSASGASLTHSTAVDVHPVSSPSIETVESPQSRSPSPPPQQETSSAKLRNADSRVREVLSASDEGSESDSSQDHHLPPAALTPNTNAPSQSAGMKDDNSDFISHSTNDVPFLVSSSDSESEDEITKASKQ